MVEVFKNIVLYHCKFVLIIVLTVVYYCEICPEGFVKSREISGLYLNLYFLNIYN